MSVMEVDDKDVTRSTCCLNIDPSCLRALLSAGFAEMHALIELSVGMACPGAGMACTHDAWHDGKPMRPGSEVSHPWPKHDCRYLKWASDSAAWSILTSSKPMLKWATG